MARLATVAIENARLSQARDRAAALGAAQNRILELAVRKDRSRTRWTQSSARWKGCRPPVFSRSILLLDEDGEHLRHGAGPSMPAAYNEAIDGIAIGPNVGSCGTAAYSNAPVFVTDIATDPLWEDFRGLALGHALRACWSLPIRSAQGTVLGTFAMYHREPREFLPADLEIVDFVVRTVGIVD